MLRALLAAVLALPVCAQQEDKTFRFDTERWLRGELSPKKPIRSFVFTAQKSDGKCSIPLKEIRPKSTAPMKILPPKTEGHIRFLKPPAPPCEKARE
jgi:hypothetical protein